MKNEGKESFIHYSAQYTRPGIVMYYRFTLLNKIEKFLVLCCFPPNKKFFKEHLVLSLWMKCSGNKTVVNLFREDVLEVLLGGVAFKLRFERCNEKSLGEDKWIWPYVNQGKKGRKLSMVLLLADQLVKNNDT